MRVRAVQIDQLTPEFGELAHAGEASVHITTGSSLARHHTREDEVLVTENEATLDTRFVGAVAHGIRIGARAAQELERVDEQRLARARFTGDHRETVSERYAQLGNDPDIFDSQLGQHPLSDPGARTWS